MCERTEPPSSAKDEAGAAADIEAELAVSHADKRPDAKSSARFTTRAASWTHEIITP